MPEDSHSVLPGPTRPFLVSQCDLAIFMGSSSNVVVDQLGIFHFKDIPESRHTFLHEDAFKDDLIERLVGAFVHLS